jgi:quinol monooxygenase YgiN
MTTVIVNHQVADVEAWQHVFDEHGTARRSHGCTAEEVFLDAGNPNDVTIVMTYPSATAAQAFLDDPSLKEAMGRAGVQSAPDIRILEPAAARISN